MMLLGLNPGAWMFWANVLSIAAMVGVAIIHRRVMPISGIAMVLNTFVAGTLWAAQGACVLPQPSLVEFRQGMTICPGQTAKINIEVPQSVSTKDL